MLAGLGALVTGIVTSAVSSLVVPIVALGLLAGGATWAIGDHKGGRSMVVAALVGGAVMLTAQTIAAGLGGAAVVTP